MSVRFQDLIDKESILLDRKRLADFNGENSLNKKIDKIMWDFLYENNMDLDNDNVAWIRNFAKKLKEKL